MVVPKVSIAPFTGSKALSNDSLIGQYRAGKEISDSTPNQKKTDRIEDHNFFGLTLRVASVAPELRICLTHPDFTNASWRPELRRSGTVGSARLWAYAYQHMVTSHQLSCYTCWARGFYFQANIESLARTPGRRASAYSRV